MVEQIQSPWTQPLGRRDLDEDPPRLDGLPFAFPVAVAFFARSKAAIYSFTIVVGEAREEWIGGGKEGREENEKALFKNPRLALYIRTLPSG